MKHVNSNGHNGRDPHMARALKAMARADAEFEAARRTKDELGAGQAAEKAWLAVVEATNAFLRLKGVAEHKLPHGQQAAFFQLRKFAPLDMVKAFVYANGFLHTDVFYRGMVEWSVVKEAMGHASGFVTRVRQMAEKK